MVSSGLLRRENLKSYIFIELWIFQDVLICLLSGIILKRNLKKYNVEILRLQFEFMLLYMFW
jgi:hypothetical protein